MVNRDFSSQILSMNGWMRSFDSGRTALIETLRAEVKNTGIECFWMHTQLDSECFDGARQIIHDTSGHSLCYGPQIDEQRRALRDGNEGFRRYSSFANQVCDLLPGPAALLQIRQPTEGKKPTQTAIGDRISGFLSWFRGGNE